KQTIQNTPKLLIFEIENQGAGFRLFLPITDRFQAWLRDGHIHCLAVTATFGSCLRDSCYYSFPLEVTRFRHIPPISVILSHWLKRHRPLLDG
ncbi:MAG: hypothetical protein KAJ40_03410, partial [Alphaproteobacteria bacterium]|nr:hypothetical protein [Alphaproteobacteria bacterium]